MAVTEDGDVWTWGRGGFAPQMRGELLGLKMAHFSCGGYHTIAITGWGGGRFLLTASEGGVGFAWGLNAYGQCGGGEGEILEAREIEETRGGRVLSAAAGEFHSVLVVARGGGGARGAADA